jgi:hypothetical protein
MNDYVALLRRDPPLSAAAIVAIIGALTICGFFFFQYALINATPFTSVFRSQRCFGLAPGTALRARS